MRIAVFTANPRLETTPLWSVVLRTPGLSAVLVVRRVSSNDPADVLRRLWRNIRKHGWFFVPYRIALLIHEQLQWFTRPPAVAGAVPAPDVSVDEVCASDIHSADVLARVRDWHPDLGVSLGAPILRPALFELPRHGTLNVHLGKVPEFRGAPPGFWELWFGATEVGATVHWIDKGLDTGAVVEQGTAPVYRHDTPARVEARAAELAQSLLSKALRDVAAGTAGGLPQPGPGRTNRIPTIGQEFELWWRLWSHRVRARFADPLAAAKIAVALAWLAVYRPLRDLVRSIGHGHPVRVFTFHRVTDLCRDGMTAAPSVFERQIDYVRMRHDVVSLDRALELLAAGRRLRRPVAAITFDDGYRSVFHTAQPVMTACGVTGACFVCTGLTSTDRRFEHDASSRVRDQMDVMDWGELGALAQGGWCVGGHTVNHARLSSLDRSALNHEVRDPVPVLREELHIECPAMAFPFGSRADSTPDAAQTVKAAGYAALFSNFGGENFPGADPFTLKRIDLGGDHDTLMWKAAVHGLDLAPWRQLLRHEPVRVRPLGAAEAVRASADAGAPIRVTQIVFDLEGGGMESLVAAMAERWKGTNVRISVITLSGRVGRVGEKVRPLVEQFHVLRLTPGLSMIWPQGLVRALQETRPDVVHLHTGAWLKGAYAARLAGVPRVVYTEHGREHNDPGLTRLQDHFASRMTDRVVAVSERLRGYMVRAIGVRADKVVKIGNGVDTELFTPGEADPSLRAALKIPDGALVLGSVGRLEPVKAYVRLVAAYAELRRVDFGRPLILVIFGDGSDRPEIEREIDRLGVRDGVRLPGWTGKPVEGYRLFDVFAMTSKSEGMSVSLMEAMACGVCPVVTDVGSNAEVLGPSLRDHVVPNGDVAQFANTVRRVLESPSTLKQTGELARRYAHEKHSISRMIREYEDLYCAGPVELDPEIASVEECRAVRIQGLSPSIRTAANSMGTRQSP